MNHFTSSSYKISLGIKQFNCFAGENLELFLLVTYYMHGRIFSNQISTNLGAIFVITCQNWLFKPRVTVFAGV